MDSDRLEDRRSHGSPERIAGKLARAMGEFALSKGLFPSKESLARKLCEDLKSCGVIYHIRTLKRRISGAIGTVPPEVESVLATVVFNDNGRRSGVDIRQLCAEAGINRPDGKDSPAYVLSEKVLPLAQLWLHLNPQASKRALANRLQHDLEKQGISYTVDTLQAILAGKNWLLVRPVIGERLVEYLRDVGINSRAEAAARIQAQAEDIRRSLAERQLLPIRRFRELCQLWLWKHHNASAQHLAAALQQRLLERGVQMNRDYIQHAVSARSRHVRRRLELVLEELLRKDLAASKDLDAALASTSRDRLRHKQDMEWVESEPIVALGKSWLEQHPNTSVLQLAIRLSARIQEMGYSRSHNTLQPILGGWKRRTRRFVYRAMLVEHGRYMKCQTRSCVFPGVQEGLCRICWLRKYGAGPFWGHKSWPALG